MRSRSFRLRLYSFSSTIKAAKEKSHKQKGEPVVKCGEGGLTSAAAITALRYMFEQDKAIAVAGERPSCAIARLKFLG